MPKKVVKFEKKIGLFWSPLILLLYLLCIATWYINIAAKFDPAHSMIIIGLLCYMPCISILIRKNSSTAQLSIGVTH